MKSIKVSLVKPSHDHEVVVYDKLKQFAIDQERDRIKRGGK
jgi:hypothetical protein